MQVSDCPMCGADGLNAVGISVRGVLDMVLFWTCPDCNYAWHRFHPLMNGSYYDKAAPYVNDWNSAREAEKRPAKCRSCGLPDGVHKFSCSTVK